MDMDNASLAMDMLRAATEQNEATISTTLKNTDTDTPSSNPNQLPVPSEYVSQFRIDGQPILPPLMTAEKRHRMQQLRQQAVLLEAKYRQAHAVRSTSTIGEREAAASDSTSSGHSSNNNSSSNSSCDLSNDTSMENTQRLPQLQQTETFIYDSTHKQKHMLLDPVNAPRSRPQTLDIEPKSASDTCLIPTICVNPPTPQCEQPKAATCTSPAPRSCSRNLSTQHRKLNNITSRILQFERTGLGRKTPLQPQPAKLLWQNEALVSAADKQMLRSSTSPSLSAAQMNMTQLHRSRSFTLEQPSQALVEHMQREGKKPPIPPPLPLPRSATTAPTSPRCRFVLPANVACSSSVQSLAHLRRDTVESKAKQVQRSASASCVDPYKSPAAGRRSGGNTAAQQQQQQLEQLLQRALHETHDVRVEQEQLERKQLAVAKRKMFKDIKSAHRDRFQQLVQYQHEEQRRMQEEFDRQQKFLIEQICAEINVSAYAHEPITDARSPSGISEYTSTDDLPTPSHSSSPANTVTLNSLETTPHSYAQFDELMDKDSVSNTARKRLFDVDNDNDNINGDDDDDDEEPMELLPPLLQSASSSPRSSSLRSRSNNSTKIKKPVQRSHSKPPGSKMSSSSPVAQGKSPPARRVNNKTTTSPTKGNSRNQPQQETISKTRRSGSPSRQTLSTDELKTQRRHIAATVLNAAARGYLVRRLFRTEQVQRIVQTIRDTLIFVLNLHLETYGNSLDQEEPANIRLKARLLQQLCSASRTLHLIFFQTSIKERMEIIARDRKRIKTKLLAMHVKQRH